MTLPRLRRVRWAVRAVLFLGVAASVTANVLHAEPNPISQSIAAWPPLALLLTIELISRVPVHRRWLAGLRLLATAAVSGIAAWVSYWHMAGVAARYGETGASPYLMPLSVDGLVVVASICLVELAGRIRDLEATPSATPSPVLVAVPQSPQPVLVPIAPMSTEQVDPAPALPPVPVRDEYEQVNAPISPAPSVHEPVHETTPERVRAPRRTDPELLRTLRSVRRVPRDPDGTVPIRRAATALQVGPERAKRLLAEAGLLRTGDDGTAPEGAPEPEPALTGAREE